MGVVGILVSAVEALSIVVALVSIALRLRVTTRSRANPVLFVAIAGLGFSQSARLILDLTPQVTTVGFIALIAVMIALLMALHAFAIAAWSAR